MAEKTFQNLVALKNVQKKVLVALGNDYKETIQPFVDIIAMTMKGNNTNEFEALKIIKEKSSLYKNEFAPMFFLLHS